MVQSQSKYVLCFLDGIRIICSKSSLIFLPAFPETKFLLKVVLYPGWYQSCQIACILFSWCTWHFTCVCCLCLLAIYEHAPAEGTEGHQSLVVSEPPHCFPTWPPISHLFGMQFFSLNRIIPTSSFLPCSFSTHKYFSEISNCVSLAMFFR